MEINNAEILLERSIINIVQKFTKNALTDSNIAAPSSPIFPLGVSPKPPISPAPRSLNNETKILINDTQFTWYADAIFL